MIRSLAKFLSYLLHPVLLPSYAVLLIFRLSSYYSTIVTNDVKQKIFIIVAVNTFAIPVLFVYLMYLRGIVKSFEMSTRTERIPPFMVTAICYFIAYYILRYLPLPKVFNLLLLGATTAIVIAT